MFALVLPTTAAAKVYRVTGDTSGRSTVSGNVVTNSITALGANQITVGIDLNAVGVTFQSLDDHQRRGDAMSRAEAQVVKAFLEMIMAMK